MKIIDADILFAQVMRKYDECLDLGELMEEIESCPEYESKAEWVFDDESYPFGSPYGHFVCSECGESVPNKSDYCPNCGRKMLD